MEYSVADYQDTDAADVDAYEAFMAGRKDEGDRGIVPISLGDEPEKRRLSIARANRFGEVIGWFAGAVDDTGTWYCDISVHPNYRKKHVATALAARFDEAHSPQVLKLAISDTTGAIRKMLAKKFDEQPDGVWTRKKDSCPRRVILDKPISEILIDFAFGYQDMPDPSFAPFQDGTWDRFTLVGSSGTISRGGSALHLRLKTDEHKFDELLRMMKVRNQPASLRLQDGSSLCAELTHMANIKPGEAYTEVNIQLYQWTWTTAITPLVWVGRLQGKVPDLGNLSLIERKNDQLKVSHQGFRFSGKYTWYIMREEPRDVSAVLVDAAGAALERDALREEFHALQFTLGGGLRLDYLTGLDGNRNVVGAMSLGSLERPRSKYRPPVAHRFDEADKWLPEFFRLLASKISQRGAEPLIIAIASYLDSQADHLDGAYLKAQVGLEAFAKRIVTESSPDLLVKSPLEWKNWVSSLIPVIQSHVLGPKQVDVSRQLDLISNKFVNAMYAPTGDVVRKALQMHGIEIPADVRHEIKKRNYPAHGFLMNKTLDDHEFDRDVLRLELIQTLIVALAAVYVGYTGPIHGYDVADDGGRLLPSWWPVRCLQEDVSVQYWATRCIGAVESDSFV